MPLIDDEPIQVLAPVNPDPVVVTIAGHDQTTTVTTMSGASYFSTGNTILEAINQGYFDPAPAYQPMPILEVQQMISPPAAAVVRDDIDAASAYAAASQDNWWNEG